ncbi:MAG: hypothetical protein GF344_10075 [Chitinivibrionales bacterium]|nr:hypothetical protein [Chitinivibrionales bacterium]MBD3357181.1 hypothetical protein [Chitinivibrionales bacterium]
MPESSTIATIRERVRSFVFRFAVRSSGCGSVRGFSFRPGAGEPDLYGTIDAVYALHIAGLLEECSSPSERVQWAQEIRGCRDSQGWFTKRNYRGHGREHATAYALGGLRLLGDTEPCGSIVELEPILSDERSFSKWINRLGFQSLRDIARKNLGWHYLWRSSHIGGGVAAIVGEMKDRGEIWIGAPHGPDAWLSRFLDWLDMRPKKSTGLWQRALWQFFYRKPTVIDLGGAAHFWWIYEKCNRPIPYPANLIPSIVSVQKPNGLYKGETPFCIDFDAVNGIITAISQLNAKEHGNAYSSAATSIEKSWNALIAILSSVDLSTLYPHSHGLPGALAALAECGRMPNARYAELLKDFRPILCDTWWL